MKRILTATAIAAALAAGNAQAAGGSDSKTVTVNITLTSACQLSAVTAVAFAYTSLQAAAQAGTGGGFTVQCTNSLPYTFGLFSGTTGATAPGAATIAVTDSAVNLGYTLGLNAAGGTGNGASQSYNVTGTMAGGQAGTCSTFPGTCSNASATNKTHTLFVNY